MSECVYDYKHILRPKADNPMGQSFDAGFINLSTCST